MALREKRGSVARPAERSVPQPQAPRPLESGRFEPSLERRWEQAWSRARAGGR